MVPQHILALMQRTLDEFTQIFPFEGIEYGQMLQGAINANRPDLAYPLVERLKLRTEAAKN